MAITNLTELIEVLKTDPTLQSVAVIRNGTSATQLRINPIAFGINSKSTTATVSVSTDGLVSLQDIPGGNIDLLRINDTSDQVYTGAQTINNESIVETYSDAKVKAYLAINDGPVVGSTGLFSEMAITDQLVVPRLSNGNIVLDNNVIRATNSNSDLELQSNAVGSVVIDSLELKGNMISTTDSSGIVIAEALTALSSLTVDDDIIIKGGIVYPDEKVRIGIVAGSDNQGSKAIAIGYQAGQRTQGQESIAIGFQAGRNNQESSCVAIGQGAGAIDQGLAGIALGAFAGQNTQGETAVAIGSNAGYSNQGTKAIAIGENAGYSGQYPWSIAIGLDAGKTNQGQTFGEAVAIGRQAGETEQGDNGTAVGAYAGQTNQGLYATALGTSAGGSNQGDSAVAIGPSAGLFNQGDYSIAIGTNAGRTNQHANSIILNASGSSLDSDGTGRFFVKPVREVATGSPPVGFYPTYYNPTTGEFIYLS